MNYFIYCGSQEKYANRSMISYINLDLKQKREMNQKMFKS
ncbi:hypothetical protein HS9_03532 [Bacillus velezensis]|nr:hypothetical protein HS9_03532 [Bacillus velezensis]